MSIAYRQLLDGVISAVTALPTTGDNVFESIQDAIRAKAIPAVVIEIADEGVEVLSEEDDTEEELQRRTLALFATSIATSPQIRDQSALEVESAIVVSALGLRLGYRGSIAVGSREGERELFGIKRRFEIQHLVDSTAPDTIVPA